MRRRDFIAVLGGAVVGWPLPARAQKMHVVGMLINGSPGETLMQTYVSAFVEGLRALNWVDGRNLRIEYRWNGGNAGRARSHAEDLAKLNPDAILASSTTNLLALQRVTTTIPIVFVSVSDPVAQGFVSNVTRPGGNITGFSAYEFSIGGKWLELLKEIAPKLNRIAVMSNPDTSPQTKFFQRAIESASAQFGVQVSAAPVRNEADIRRAIDLVAGSPAGGLILPTDSFTRLHQGRIAELANQASVPALSASADFVDEGGLMFYGATGAEQVRSHFRQAASYVDRVLKGAKPGDLPIQGAEKFELAINRKTANILGLEIPPKLLFTADKVIE